MTRRQAYVRRVMTGFAVVLLVGTFATQALQQSTLVQFSDIAEEAGIRFKHENGASADKHLPETMGAGGLLFDYDGDGWLDIFLVNGGDLNNPQKAALAHHALYRNTRNGKFSEVTATGIEVFGYGMGTCSADFDNDGREDLYITGVTGNRLYKNNGDGNFSDVTEAAGVAGSMWSTSCSFGDVDNDGDVDLYVARYVDFTVGNSKVCEIIRLTRAYCHPNLFNPLADLLFRNNGDGTFTNVSRESGIGSVEGNGLGVVFGDYDNDGWTDIYVANDSTPNFLFHNKGKGIFEEVGLAAGVAVGLGGRPLAGMGTDMGDIDGDGLLDIIVTNLSQQTHSLYRNLGQGLFDDMTFPSGIGKLTLPYVGFGTVFFDFDNDFDLDLAIVNGDVDDIGMLKDQSTYEQLNLLLQNDGTGKFLNVGPVSGPGFAIEKPSRALAVGDIDNDGDLDVLIANVGRTPNLLRNDGGSEQNSLLIRTVGTKSNRDGIGTRMKLTVGKKVLMRYVKSGSSYLSQSDTRLHFGLGHNTHADRLEVLWPSGLVDVVTDIEANRMITIREGNGIMDQKPFPEFRQKN